MSAAGERLPTLYIPHGGGPCFFMEWTMGPPDTWDLMAEWLRGLGSQIEPRPRGLVVVSAHWEEPVVAVNHAAHRGLLYDYYGFPPHTYHITYDAPGDPALAREIVGLLERAGITARPEEHRGLDHGVFVPLKLVYPEADVPIVAVSLRGDLDPRFHLSLGRALAPLRAEGVLIIGSGMSYHDMTGFMTERARTDSRAFDDWLTETCAAPPDERERRLASWQVAPSARACHPREEHLLPLMVAAGAAPDDPGERVFTDQVMGATVSAFRFG